MEEFESVLNDYISLGYPISTITSLIRREMAKDRLPSEIEGIISSYTTPKKLPFGAEEAEMMLSKVAFPDYDDYGQVKNPNPQEAKRLAKRILFWYPSYNIADFIMSNNILPVSEAVSYLLRKDTNLPNHDAGRMWLELMANKEYGLAKQIYRRYPNLSFDNEDMEYPVWKAGEHFDSGHVSEYAKYPSILAKNIREWSDLSSFYPQWRTNLDFQYALEQVRKINSTSTL